MPENYGKLRREQIVLLLYASKIGYKLEVHLRLNIRQVKYYLYLKIAAVLKALICLKNDLKHRLNS